MNIELFPFSLSTEIEMVIRLIVAAVVGGVIGFERRRAARPAGIRTMSLVAMGAAVFTVVSIFGFSDGVNQTRDPARIAAQVATGVGFIGAGTMIRTGATVRGLTTAAGIWIAAALGVAAGAGMFVLAVSGAVIAIIILYLFPRRHDVGYTHSDEHELELDKGDAGDANS